MKFTSESLRLYAVTDRTWLNGRTLGQVVGEAITGGATLIQLREKDAGYDVFKYQALEIQRLCRQHNIPFIVNDNVNLAVDIDADGVHVGQDDMNAANVRELIGAGKILGVSVRTPEEALLAESRGADYLGAGAVFHTGSKSDAVDITHEALREICRSVKIPVVAIGGINALNAHELSGSGIAGLAVISAIFASPDIMGAAQELRSIAEEICS